MTQQWQRDGRILYLLNDQGGRRFNVTVDPGWPNPEDAWAMAESILRAVNAHEALVQAIKSEIDANARIVRIIVDRPADPCSTLRGYGRIGVGVHLSSRRCDCALQRAS